MANDTGDAIAEGRLDLVPMIDCVMLLLMFFILTTKFSGEEKSIASLLPTNQGTNPTKAKVEIPQMVNIAVFPADGGSGEPMPRGLQPSAYRAMYEQAVGQRAVTVMPAAAIRIGQNEPIVIPVRELAGADRVRTRAAIEAVHAAMREQLKAYEVPGDRKSQRQVVVHAFSGLSWRYALLVYDAVRAYEAEQGGQRRYEGNPADLLAMRSVAFAPPRVRDYSANELGDELAEIVNLR